MSLSEFRMPRLGEKLEALDEAKKQALELEESLKDKDEEKRSKIKKSKKG